jgi:hypothetical protein
MSAHEYLDPESKEEKSPYVIREAEKRRCWQDIGIKNFPLDIGAKGLFTVLCDNVEMRNMGGGQIRGVICISVTDLARFMRVAEKSIRRWKHQLLTRSYIWWSTKKMPNTWDMHIIHLTCLDPMPANAFQRTFDDARWGGQEPNGHAVIKSNPPTAENPSKNEDAGTKRPPPPVTDTAPGGNNDRSRRSSLPPPPVIMTGEEAKPRGHNDRVGRSLSPAGAVKEGTRQRSQSPVKKSIQINSTGTKDNGGGDTPPEALEEQLKAWEVSLGGVFRSKLEKMMAELKLQRSQTTAQNVREVLTRKINAVKERLFGPLPPAVETAMAPEPAATVKAEDPAVIAKLAADLRAAVASAAVAEPSKKVLKEIRFKRRAAV